MSNVPTITYAERKHVEGMISCQMAAYRRELLTMMGRSFLRCYYGYLIKHHNAVCVVAVDDTTLGIAGFCVGGRAGTRGQFVRCHATRVVFTVAWRFITNQLVRRRVLGIGLDKLRSHFRREARSDPHSLQEGPPHVCWLHLVCTHPLLQRRSIGESMMGEFVARAGERGYEIVRLTVARDNTAAVGLYKKLGWVFAGNKGGLFVFERRAEQNAPTKLQKEGKGTSE